MLRFERRWERGVTMDGWIDGGGQRIRDNRYGWDLPIFVAPSLATYIHKVHIKVPGDLASQLQSLQITIAKRTRVRTVRMSMGMEGGIERATSAVLRGRLWRQGYVVHSKRLLRKTR